MTLAKHTSNIIEVEGPFINPAIAIANYNRSRELNCSTNIYFSFIWPTCCFILVPSMAPSMLALIYKSDQNTWTETIYLSETSLFQFENRANRFKEESIRTRSGYSHQTLKTNFVSYKVRVDIWNIWVSIMNIVTIYSLSLNIYWIQETEWNLEALG